MLKKIACLFSLILSTVPVTVSLWVTILILRDGRLTLVEPNPHVLHVEVVMLTALLCLCLVSIITLWRWLEVEAGQGSEREGSS